MGSSTRWYKERGGPPQPVESVVTSTGYGVFTFRPHDPVMDQSLPAADAVEIHGPKRRGGQVEDDRLEAAAATSIGKCTLNARVVRRG